MLIRFLRDYRSAATLEVFYTKGQVDDLDRGAEIVAEGAAEAVPLTAREGQVTPKAPKISESEPEPEPPRPAPTTTRRRP